MKKYRICNVCAIPHYENCESCWGFGVYSFIPGDAVRAGDVIDGKLKGEVFPCPECGSTEKGIPINK